MKTRQHLEDMGYSEDYIEGYYEAIRDLEIENEVPQRWDVREPAAAPSKRWRCDYHGLEECTNCHPALHPLVRP